MTETVVDAVANLQETMGGRVVAPGDPDYDRVRAVWNADIDRHPSVIAQCVSAVDVAAAVSFARAHGLEIAVRGGAHSMSGASTVEDGLVVDLSLMREVVVDPDARRARVGGGALLSDLDAATQRHGLAVPAGMISHTGVGGLTLGGGMGWLTRKAGLTIDNLVSAEVVLADGRIVRASATEHPDLFWALRGGGGNFGVVTEFEFQLHPVGPMVQLGLFFWELRQGGDVLRLARDLVADLPPEVNILIAGLNAPPAPFVPEQHHFQPGYALLLTGFDDGPEHAALTDRIRAALPPLFDMVSPMPFEALQQLLDTANGWGQLNYEKSTYLPELSDAVIDVVTEHLPAKTSPLSVVLFYRLDAAYSEVGEDDTAFGGTRSPHYAVFIVAIAHDQETLASDRAWARSLWEALQPSTDGTGTYVNAMTEYDENRVRATYGPAKYARLTQIKTEYDPTNVFHRNINIAPL